MGRPDEEDRKRATEGSALLYEHNETRKLLEELRKTRKMRGGVGAPLVVPDHLRDAAAGQGIIVTDADLNPNATKSREQQDDDDTDLARRIYDGSKE